MTRAELEKRLQALQTDDGDWAAWPELARRGHSERRRVVRRRVLVAAVAALVLAVPAFALAERLTGLVIEDAAPEGIPSATAEQLGFDHVDGDTLHLNGDARRLAQPLWAPLLGEDAALAVPSPDGRAVVYHAWDADGVNGTPLLRLVDSTTGADSVLASGAQSVAWRADGAIATMQALRPKYEQSAEGSLGGRFGHVVVRPAPAAPSTRWTSMPTEYTVRAWAGNTLLVHVRPSYAPVGPQPDRGLHALDGPRRLRALPLDDLVAVSPDGTLAAGPPLATGDSPTEPFLVIVRVADGSEVARFRLPRGLNSIAGVGSWSGRHIVARTPQALLVLRVAGEELTHERTIRLNRETALAAGVAGFRGVGIGQPALVGDRYVVFRANVLGEGDRVSTMFLACERTGPVCRKGRELPPRRWAALVLNPSRPLPNRGR